MINLLSFSEDKIKHNAEDTKENHSSSVSGSNRLMKFGKSNGLVHCSVEMLLFCAKTM